MELNKTYPGGYDENITKRFQAIRLLWSAYYKRYLGIWDELKNSKIMGTENYPKTPTAAYDIFCRYKKPEP